MHTLTVCAFFCSHINQYMRTTLPGLPPSLLCPSRIGSLAAMVAVFGPGSLMAEYTGQNARVYAKTFQNFLAHFGSLRPPLQFTAPLAPKNANPKNYFSAIYPTPWVPTLCP
jgi:hypothetical protein